MWGIAKAAVLASCSLVNIHDEVVKVLPEPVSCHTCVEAVAANYGVRDTDAWSMQWNGEFQPAAGNWADTAEAYFFDGNGCPDGPAKPAPKPEGAPLKTCSIFNGKLQNVLKVEMTCSDCYDLCRNNPGSGTAEFPSYYVGCAIGAWGPSLEFDWREPKDDVCGGGASGSGGSGNDSSSKGSDHAVATTDEASGSGSSTDDGSGTNDGSGGGSSDGPSRRLMGAGDAGSWGGDDGDLSAALVGEPLRRMRGGGTIKA